MRTEKLTGQAWWKDAIAKYPPANWFEIRRGTDEFASWKSYFSHQGWMPWGLKMLMIGKLEMIILPTQWPEWFDSDYAMRPAE